MKKSNEKIQWKNPMKESNEKILWRIQWKESYGGSNDFDCVWIRSKVDEECKDNVKAVSVCYATRWLETNAVMTMIFDTMFWQST